MTRRPSGNELAILSKPPLLITESADEFDALHKALQQEIKPRGVIEQMYVADISYIQWEILRLRRCKVVIVNVALQFALEKLLLQLLNDDNYDYANFAERNADAIAQACAMSGPATVH